MARDKGAHVLLRALKSQPGVSARLIGGRWFHALSEETRYERRIRRGAARLGERVEVMGPLPPAEVRAHRAVAKVAVVPSVWEEPLGLTVLEGMVSGSAVVATRVGGIPELARAGGVLLVEPGSHSQLAEAIAHLLADEAARHRLSQAGIDASGAMSWVANYKTIRDLLDSLPSMQAGS
jgi:glycosyltransferase involved in cell wall biosynthesis